MTNNNSRITNHDFIPLSVPSIQGNEWKYIKECLDTEWVSSAGKYVDLFEEKIAEYTGSEYAVACVNGTAALHIALKMAGVKPGDEVIVPTLTFIAPVNAVSYNGAEPVFMDADDYYNIDSKKTIEFINKETVFKDGFTFNKKTNRRITAIIPVHVFGNAVNLKELVPLCKERNISIVEDAAESMGTRYINGEYSGKHTGTIGHLGCLSFNGNKIITTGGGGMILTDDANLAEKAKYLTEQAKDDRVRYIHNEIGYNFRLTNIQAALGVAQLEQLQIFLKRKKEIHTMYVDGIKDIEELSIAPVPEYADNNHWLNVLKIESKVYLRDKKTLMKGLQKAGVQSRPIWNLNHMQKPYRDCQIYKIKNALSLVKNSILIPSSVNLDSKEIKTVIDGLKNS